MAESDAAADPASGTSASPPVFGAAFTSGSAAGGFGGFAGSGGVSGFGGFGSEAPLFGGPAAGAGGQAGEDDDDNKDPEAECQAQFKPVVELEEVAVTTGEEDEECLFEMKSKLYRFEPDTNEWKERGVGPVKLLKHKESGKVRLLHRNDKTLKIRANHIVMPGTNLMEHTGTDNAWVFSTWDFADEEQKYEMFAIKFGNEERAEQFKCKHAECMNMNSSLGIGDDDGDGEGEGAEGGEDKPKSDDAADELAAKLEGTAVGEKEAAKEEEEA